MPALYCPSRGDVVWMNFDPQAGHEQSGRRPALVVSPESYNRKVGLALICPITSRAKGYPFEVALPVGLDVSGVVLSDQLKNLDWRARDARFAFPAPTRVLQEVLARLGTLLTD